MGLRSNSTDPHTCGCYLNTWCLFGLIHHFQLILLRKDLDALVVGKVCLVSVGWYFLWFGVKFQICT